MVWSVRTQTKDAIDHRGTEDAEFLNHRFYR